MRYAVTVSFLLLLSLGLVPGTGHAEDAPAAEAAGEPTEGDGWDTGELWFAKILPPAEAWTRLTADLRSLPYAQRRTAQVDRATAYLRVWAAAGKDVETTPEDRGALGRFQITAQQWGAAAATFQAVMAATENELAARDEAATSLAGLLINPAAAEQLGAEALVPLKDGVESYLASRDGEDAGVVRGRLHNYLARYYGGLDDDAAQVEHQMQAALEDPSQAASVGRTLMRGLMSSTHTLDGYDTVRTSGTALLTVLKNLAARHLASLGDDVDERTRERAEAGVRTLESAGRPLAMLGNAAEEWTLEHAYGDVTTIEDLRGKVVLLDFWATWCPWCIKSFPAIRDLIRDYGDQGFAVVGVTASASSVYAHRYDLDDDLKDRASGDRAVAVARLARGEPQPDATPPQLAEAEFRALERDTLATFIKNHEMTWPVVLIDKTEPSSKFALTGWPHAVVLDRQGRIRYFKVGALLRDRVEAVEHFRAVLEDLLAESEDAE